MLQLLHMQNASKSETWFKLIEEARWAPTPHNIQPYVLHVTSDNDAVICFDSRYAIPATDPKQEFLHVGLGVFIETIRLVAASMGHILSYELTTEGKIISTYYHQLAKLTLKADKDASPDIDVSLIRKRRTSRLPFDGKTVSSDAITTLKSMKLPKNHSLAFTSDPKKVKAVVRFNSTVLVHDLIHTGLRTELTNWTRISKKSYTHHKNGFSAATLNQSPWKLWFFTRFYWLLNLQYIKNYVIRKYENASGGVGTVGWFKGPFTNQSDQLNAGIAILRFWLHATSLNLYLQPYGSVITNDSARKRVLAQLGVKEGEGEMCWLLFRIGSGETPPKSLRKNTEEYFI